MPGCLRPVVQEPREPPRRRQPAGGTKECTLGTAGLWPDVGHHQRLGCADQRPPGHSKPTGSNSYADCLDGGSLFHVLQVTRGGARPQPLNCSTINPLFPSYFAIFGGLFGFRNFGRLLAIDNTFNGLFGLLQVCCCHPLGSSTRNEPPVAHALPQYPLTYVGIHWLDGNFTIINIVQAATLLPLFFFCYCMYAWEREDLIPVRCRGACGGTSLCC